MGIRSTFVWTLAAAACGGAAPERGPAAATPSAPAVTSSPPTESAPAPPPAASSGATAADSAAAPPASTAGAGRSDEASVLIGEIAAPKTFDPKPTVARLEPDFVSCFRQARASTPDLHGKLKLRVVINEAGAVQSVSAEPGGSANDPALVACLGGALKAAPFPKPSGTAILVVPLVFRHAR